MNKFKEQLVTLQVGKVIQFTRKSKSTQPPNREKTKPNVLRHTLIRTAEEHTKQLPAKYYRHNQMYLAH